MLIESFKEKNISCISLHTSSSLTLMSPLINLYHIVFLLVATFQIDINNCVISLNHSSTIKQKKLLSAQLDTYL
jgi:hypothetical protein